LKDGILFNMNWYRFDRVLIVNWFQFQLIIHLIFRFYICKILL
jgi:hypothetical protein